MHALGAGRWQTSEGGPLVVALMWRRLIAAGQVSGVQQGRARVQLVWRSHVRCAPVQAAKAEGKTEGGVLLNVDQAEKPVFGTVRPPFPSFLSSPPLRAGLRALCPAKLRVPGGRGAW